jgi:hypothetical protein
MWVWGTDLIISRGRMKKTLRITGLGIFIFFQPMSLFFCNFYANKKAAMTLKFITA